MDTVKITKITPETAKVMLSKHDDSLRQQTVAKRVKALIKSMEEGEWMNLTRTITINKDGTIIDGVRRLKALVAVKNENFSIKVILTPLDNS